jgi:hypothetical protein
MPSTNRATPPPSSAPVAVPPHRSIADANRVRYSGGYYDPDAAAFDDARLVDLDKVTSATAPLRPTPQPALARATR